jgi:hypothetical protein
MGVFLVKCDWLCLGEVRLALCLTLFAIAGIIFWRIRYYFAPDELRTFRLPQAPGHVFIWFLIAAALSFVGAFIAPSPL